MKFFKFYFVISIALLCSIIISCKSDITVQIIDNDTVIDTITVNDGKATILHIPKKDYYKFNGCTDQRGTGNSIFDENGNSIVKIENNMSVFINWTPNQILINFDAGYGEIHQDNTIYKINYDGSIDKMPYPILNNYDFIGWFDENGIQYSEGSEVINNKKVINIDNYDIIDNKINLIAKYKIHKYTITFNYNDNITPESTARYDYNYKLLDTDYPFKDNGTSAISYWVTDLYKKEPFDGIVSTDITLYAIWSSYKTINLHYSSSEIITEFFFENDNIINDGIKKGYTFEGWYDNPSYAKERITNFSYNTLLKDYYAKFTPNSYKVSFETEDSNIKFDSIEVTYDSAVELPKIDKIGYIFLGWYYNDEKVENGTWKIDDNITLKPKFEKQTYKINLNANGGVCEESEIKITIDSNVFLPDPSREGYKFLGWFDNNTKFTDTVYKYDNDLNLKAEWEIINYTVQLDLNGGECSKTEINFNVINPAMLPTPTKIGYEFVGWYVNNSLVTNNCYYKLENITAKAKWKVRTYTISFVTNNGQSLESQNYSYGVITNAPKELSLTDHFFTGWSFDVSGFSFGDSMPATNIIATANWTRINNTITFSTTNNTRDKNITDSDGVYDYIKPNMNKQELISLGYTKLYIEIKFDCFEEKDGYQDLWIEKDNGNVLASYTVNAGGTSPWYKFGAGNQTWLSFSFTTSINIKDLTDTCSFKLEWGAHSEDIQNSEDDWTLGYTVITIKAIK